MMIKLSPVMLKPLICSILAVFLLMFLLAAIEPQPATAVTTRQPQILPTTMPVYAINTSDVNPSTVLANAGLFNSTALTSTMVYTVTAPGGLQSIYVVNPTGGFMVHQYSQTGGLFALNSSQAFTETLIFTSTVTNSAICKYLNSQEMFPYGDINPLCTMCDGVLPYTVKQIHLATMESTPSRTPTGTPTHSIIGRMVQIPLAVNIGAGAPNYIPFGGPGGHFSLLLAGSPNGSSLDSRLPGLQGFAAPWFGRSRSPNPIGYYNVVPQEVAVRRFEARFPREMQVTAGLPEMVYYIDFPDRVQGAAMPTWTFPDATGIIDGQVVSLKTTTLPGVEDFAPEVNITNPMDGAVILNGQALSIAFSITGDKGPFAYTVFLDGTQLASGTSSSGVTQSLSLGVMPPSGDRSEGRILSVRAVNGYSQSGEATVFLGSPSYIWLPVVMRAANQLAAGPPNPLTAKAMNATMRIGVEWVMNYHDPDSNLSQTRPDAEGLRNWLWSALGWNRVFNYGNDAAWEKDWRDCSLGGIDCYSGVDRAEFVYFAGHGSPSRWYFGVSKDNRNAWAGNARFQNVRWAAFSTCRTVRGGPFVGPGNPPLTEWFNSFQGSYMILGFHSGMADIAFGANFGMNMYNPLHVIFPSLQPSIREAWVGTAFAMNAGKPSYLYAVGNLNPVNFKLPAGNAAPPPPLANLTQFRWVWWDE